MQNKTDHLLKFAWAGLAQSSRSHHISVPRLPGGLFMAGLYVTLVLFTNLASIKAATFIVQMSNYSFVPRDQTISVGDTVTWTNLDADFHNTVSVSNGVPNSVWRSSLFGKGASFSFTFNIPPGNYPYVCTPHAFIGMVGSITVVATNVSPSVSISQPTGGATFTLGDTVLFQASATDPDGTVARVDFSVNGNPVGSATSPPYGITLNNLAVGQYTLSAVAVDNQGASSTPASIQITVQAGNAPPSVSIINLVDGQTFLAGTNVVIEAAAADPDGSVTQVEFFSNGSSLGTVSNQPYSLVLSNLTVGSYALTARATDNVGASSSSTPVSISVVALTERPTILTQPQSQTVVVGNSVTLSVSAAGTPPLSYQWQLNGTNIFGQTNDKLLLTGLLITDSGNYTVLVSNSAGSVTSQPAVLTVTLPANIPPVIAITNPQNATKFPSNGIFTLEADASDSDGNVVQVEFLVGTNSVGILTNRPFSLALTNLLAGTYVLAAKATDNRGAITTSPAVSISVINPPTVALTQPIPGASFPLGSSLTLVATAGATGALVTNVEFAANASSLGRTTTSPFTISWTPTGMLSYSLAAIATDALGQSTTSAPIIIRVFIPETTLPKITITSSPPNFARLKSPQVSLAGTANDNIGLDHVEFQVNGGSFQPASGTALWTSDIVLSPGNNTIRVRSVDFAGNPSLPATRFLTYVADAPLNVQIVGEGTTTPNLDGRALEVGKIYTLTARPGPGQLFAGWSGGANTPNQKMSFQMQPDLALTATFVPNPFPTHAGGYSGLFFNTNVVTAGSSGSFTLQLGKLGSFTGKLTIGGAKYAFSGKFNHLGNVVLPVRRIALVPVILTLQLDLTGDSNQILGTVTDGTWSSSLLAVQGVPDAKGNPPPKTSPPSFILKRTEADGSDLVATGKATISHGGSVGLSGRLTDGRKFSAATVLAKDGTVPFYFSFTRGTELLIGWFHFPGNPAALGDGTVFWTKSDPNGFLTELEVAPGD